MEFEKEEILSLQDLIERMVEMFTPILGERPTKIYIELGEQK